MIANPWIRIRILTWILIRIQIGPKTWIRIQIQCIWIHNTEAKAEYLVSIPSVSIHTCFVSGLWILSMKQRDCVTPAVGSKIYMNYQICVGKSSCESIGGVSTAWWWRFTALSCSGIEPSSLWTPWTPSVEKHAEIGFYQWLHQLLVVQKFQNSVLLAMQAPCSPPCLLSYYCTSSTINNNQLWILIRIRLPEIYVVTRSASFWKTLLAAWFRIFFVYIWRVFSEKLE